MRLSIFFPSLLLMFTQTLHATGTPKEADENSSPCTESLKPEDALRTTECENLFSLMRPAIERVHPTSLMLPGIKWAHSIIPEQMQEKSDQDSSPPTKSLERQGAFHTNLPTLHSDINRMSRRSSGGSTNADPYSYHSSPTSPEEPNWRRIHEPLLDAIKSGKDAVSAVAAQYKTRIIVHQNTQGNFVELFNINPEGINRLVFLIICSTGATSWSFTE